MYARPAPQMNLFILKLVITTNHDFMLVDVALSSLLNCQKQCIACLLVQQQGEAIA